MIAKLPELHKQPGVCYAVTDDGIELPVIDVTHPAFAFELSAAELNQVIDQFVLSLHRAAMAPAGAMQAAAQQSVLIRGMLESADTYTSGMVTYLHKLGPANLGEAWATPVDRQWAAGLTPLTFRWRMRDVANLLAAGLATQLASRPATPVLLFNIGGGPGADSWNALILLNREHPELLAERTVEVFVLDVDGEGPHFGARALAALRAPGAPLAGVDVTLQHIPYDWANPAPLASLLADLEAKDAVAVCSSEGGLFEYAADTQIVVNLAVLRAGFPPEGMVVGPVVRNATTLDPRLVASEYVPGRPAVRYLGLEAFARLAEQAGWCIDRTLDGPMHQVVRLRVA